MFFKIKLICVDKLLKYYKLEDFIALLSNKKDSKENNFETN
ncbi:HYPOTHETICAL PROTEIN MCJ_003130 [Mesomycoplasma conjunctivae]|uniref:Uncharacterized protein n=1 Tax=Mesomycoplasma conjunctivae (strain ATCC 25834 / NCTC 10147 / HRC/581) TaxID=572263 RepID=C5J6B2_MESCH|nr:HYPOTHETICAL PROTEIN MCJ_003130 [Mesomycoplasma conjunctivae]